jgi:soluble lytic murein transglycosylase-like protein
MPLAGTLLSVVAAAGFTLRRRVGRSDPELTDAHAFAQRDPLNHHGTPRTGPTSGQPDSTTTGPGPTSAGRRSPLRRLAGWARTGGTLALLAVYVVAALVVLSKYFGRTADPQTPQLPQQLVVAPELNAATRAFARTLQAPMLPRVGLEPAADHPAPPPLRRASVRPDSAALEREAVQLFAHGPIARVLRRRTDNPAVADSIARALLREANRLKIAPSVLTAVLMTENPRLEPHVVSSQGATGLMQVMPFHAGEHGCASDDLLQVEANICHGARILGQYLKRNRGDMNTALLRYNGCVRSTNTPRCHRYPSKVLALAHKVRGQILSYARDRKPEPAVARTPAPAPAARRAAPVRATTTQAAQVGVPIDTLAMIPPRASD